MIKQCDATYKNPGTGEVSQCWKDWGHRVGGVQQHWRKDGTLSWTDEDEGARPSTSARDLEPWAHEPTEDVNGLNFTTKDGESTYTFVSPLVEGMTTGKIGDALFDEDTQYYVDEGGSRKGFKSARYDLIPHEALAELAKAYGEGERKYPSNADGTPNYLVSGYPYWLSFGAMMRHAWRWWAGEDFDKETGVHHLSMVAWHAFTLQTFQRRGLGKDTRPK